MKMISLQRFLHHHLFAIKHVSDATQEMQRGQFFEKLAHETHLHEDHYTVSSDDRNAMWYFLRAALRGDANASFKLGVSYLQGDLGLDKDYQKAKEWLERADHQGHPHAKQCLYEAYDQITFS